MSYDYYGYAPMTRLDRPLVLCGLPGAEPGATARVVSMFTGIPLVRVTDKVAHLAGEAYELHVMKAGVDAALDLEAQVLRRALDGRSPPVIGLSDFTLQRAALRQELLARADVRYLHMTLEESVHRIRVAALDDPRRYAAIRAGDPPDALHLMPRLRFLDRLCREAPVRIDIREQTPMAVGRALAASL